MSDHPRLEQLLDELGSSQVTPEEVCASCPELLPLVRERWQRLCRVRDQIDALFPPPPDTDLSEPAVQLDVNTLPVVPGYEVEAVLGLGGMGVVFRARHLKLNRVVAMKMALAGAYAGSRERERFQREAEAVAVLRHPNVVQVHDVGDSDGRPYFTMEYVEGGSLAQKLAGIPLPAREAATLLAVLAGAVHAAHQSGIVHRDLKPANVLLTADGVPKITDFGLARRVGGEAGLTRTGTAMGTPSYMAPEQARGKPDAVGPATDIYSLGAILYELLAGRPPFRAETGAETVYQMLSQDAVPPSRLNGKVPRDLETICLKCLHKEPQLRYATAAALADDLSRFLEGRPIQARHLRWGARLLRWGKRKPLAAALVAMVLALAGLALGGGLWLERQRAERREETARQEGRESQAVEAVLKQAADLQKQGRWPDAKALLEGAPSLLGASAPAALYERVKQARADADMVAELEEIRLRLLEGRRPHETVAPSGDRLYAEAFRKYGIALTTMEPVEAEERIRNSAIRETLLAFLHDWLHWVSDADRDKLRAVVDRADDNAWRRGFRGALAANDNGKLKELLKGREAPTQPPVVLAGLGGALVNGLLEEEARALLRESQQRHPEDFWINFQLGCYFLQKDRPQEAVGYFRAAVASRPESGQAHTMLGRALRDTGDTDGAISAFRNAIELNPNRAGGRDLAKVLAPRDKLEEARAVWEKILKDDPPDYYPWDGYAPLCAFLGNEKAYHRARKALLKHERESTDHWTVAERDSVACLLLPASGDELRGAVVLADRAVAGGPKFPHPDNAYLQLVKGLAEYRQGRAELAVPLLEESASLLPNRASPRLVLALAQFQSGAVKEARKNLVVAVRAYNWKESQADHPTAWVSQALRREAEALILPNLQAFFQGEYQPRDNDERFVLLASCQIRGLYCAAARLYADAFAAEPDLADNLTTECRYRTLRDKEPFDDRMEPLDTECRYLAARCAALAGCGLGKDGAKLSAAERSRWREQARKWLRADLAAWSKTLDGGSEKDRSVAKKMLMLWRAEPDLAGLRELKALGELSAEERKECLALWDEVGIVLMEIAQSRPAASLEPKHTILIRQGRLEEARVAWKTALEANPLEHTAWFGYAELCLFLGREDEYRLARQALLARFGATVDEYIAERTSRTCLLMPASGDELRQAAALAGRAVAADKSVPTWAYPWFLFAQGLAEYRQGRFDRAIFTMRGEASRVPRPSPGLVLAMALHRSGQVAEARKTLVTAILSYDWRANQARDHDDWIPHLFRREAEALMLPNLPAFLEGKYQPRDNDERLALLGVCQFTNRTRAAARFYADAFADAPRLAEDIGAGHRYRAACAAALAGCGRGVDVTGINESERTQWRAQARQWLRADLALCVKVLDGHSGLDREWVRGRLMQWQGDPDLAGLRERAELGNLSADERNDCLALWNKVGVVLNKMQSAK
jgi:tetratricopeptide (TPR) repeat protein/tRNA A-37 threonylcarbamoyl transferase component Bud32